MRKLYAAPILLASGNVVRETRQGDATVRPEAVAPLIYYLRPAGSVGFGL